jgi:hypothetical protein
MRPSSGGPSRKISRFGDAEGVITLQPAENETGADAPLFHSLPSGKVCTKHDAVSVFDKKLPAGSGVKREVVRCQRAFSRSKVISGRQRKRTGGAMRPMPRLV